MKVERLIDKGRRETRTGVRRGSIESILSEDDMRSLLLKVGGSADETGTGTATEEDEGSDVITGDEFESEEVAVVDTETEPLIDAEENE